MVHPGEAVPIIDWHTSARPPGQSTPDRQAEKQKTAAPTAGPCRPVGRRRSPADRSPAPPPVGPHPDRPHPRAPRASSRVRVLLCRRRHHPPSPRPMHGVPAERRQERCPCPTKAPRGRLASRSVPSLRLVAIAALASVMAVGGLAAQPETVAAAGQEGRHRRRPRRLEHRELHLQREEARRAGPLLWRHRLRDLQPPCDVGAGEEPQPRARTSSSTWATATATRARTAPSASTRRTASGSTRRRQLGPQVLRRVLRRPLPELRAERGRDPQPPVLRLGQLRVGFGQPDEDDRDQAGRQLRRGLPPDRRPGGLRRGHQQRVVHPVRPVQDEPDDEARSSGPTRPGAALGLQLLSPGPRASTAIMDPTPGHTTARSSATWG